jgi:cytochrome P450/nitrite reductase/ring-hydroxylating ferredoxin subunit
MTTHERRCFVARRGDLPGDGPHHVTVEGTDLVLLRVDGQLRAFDGHCPHQGALLGEGELEGDALVCRNHRWRFDARTGERIGGPQCLRRHAVHEEGDRIEVVLVRRDDEAATKAVSAAGDEPGRPPTTTKGTRTRADLPGPRPWPLVGNALQLETRRLHSTLEGWAREHGPLYRLQLGPRPFVVVSDPALVAEILRKRPETYRRLDRLQDVFEEVGVTGVFSAEGAAWRPQRKLAMGALDHRHLSAFFDTLREVAERLHRRWEQAANEGRVLDVQSEMMRFTIDVTTRLAFSHPTDTIGGKQSKLLDDLDPVFPEISRRLNAAFPYWRILKLPADRRLERALASVRDWLATIIAKTRQELAADPARAADPRNFLEAMLLAKDADGRPFSDEVVFGNAMTMLLAGEDTTANTLSWAVHFLLDAPDELAALQARVDEVLGEHRVPPHMSTTRALDDIEAVANETMRLRPVAPLMFFQNVPAVTLGDLRLPPGSALCVLMRVAGMDPARVDDPEAFRPARWRDGRIAAEMQRSGMFVPFGSGPRICPGRSLALLEIRVVLATLLRSFDIERVGRREDVGEEFGFTLTPTGLRMRLRPRSGPRA